MPQYKYKCSKCLQEIDIEHKFSESLQDVIDEVPCGDSFDDYYKVIGNVGYIYKGTGWVNKAQKNANSKIPQGVWDTYEKVKGG